MFNNVFHIPINSNQHIVYLPIQGIIFSGNSAAVNLFNKALQGDEKGKEEGRDAFHVSALCRELEQ